MKQFVFYVKTIILLSVMAAVFLEPPGVMAGYPQRIISLAPNLTEIICDLGLENRIVAVTDYCDYPPVVSKKPKVGGFSNPSLETIVSLKPDLVVMTIDGNPQALDIRLRKIGVKTYIFKARRIRELPSAIRSLGEALGVKGKADIKAKWFEDELWGFEEKKRVLSRAKIKKAVYRLGPRIINVIREISNCL